MFLFPVHVCVCVCVNITATVGAVSCAVLMFVIEPLYAAITVGRSIGLREREIDEREERERER